MNGFYSDLKSMDNIPVATVVIAYNGPISGTTVMLVFDQALWFVISMGKSLIATNQVRSHGIKLSDNPFG